MLLMYATKKLARNLMMTDQQRLRREKRLEKIEREREEYREWMLQQFGLTRCILFTFLGPWALYAFNNRPALQTTKEKPVEQPAQEATPAKLTFDEKPYQKFYRDLKVAQRYEKMLQKKYSQVELINTYDQDDNLLGYMLIGKEKII